MVDRRPKLEKSQPFRTQIQTYRHLMVAVGGDVTIRVKPEGPQVVTLVDDLTRRAKLTGAVQIECLTALNQVFFKFLYSHLFDLELALDFEQLCLDHVQLLLHLLTLNQKVVLLPFESLLDRLKGLDLG